MDLGRELRFHINGCPSGILCFTCSPSIRTSRTAFRKQRDCFSDSIRRLDTKPRHIQRRQEQEREQRSDDDAAHHRVGHRTPEDFARDRYQRQAGGSRRQQDRPHAMFGGLHHRLPCGLSFLLQVLDLHDQDHRVADQDADQGKNAEDRHETERRAARQQRHHDADQCKRRHCAHQEQLVKTLQLKHQDRGHDEDHQRNDRGDRRLALGAFFNRAADVAPNSPPADPLRTRPLAARADPPPSSAARYRERRPSA